MHIMRASFVGRALANHGFAANQCRFAIGFATLCFGGFDGCVDGGRIVSVNCGNHIPAIGFKTFGCVISEPAFYMAVDGNAVVVVKRNQLGQTQGASQRAGFMADTFHHATIAQEHVCVVIHNRVVGLVELLRQ